MIRIDEIYYNTFLARLQSRPNCGLHWFEPFGTTKFENVCDQPSVGYYEANQRIFFWDQEPIHRNRVNDVFWQFLEKFKKPYHDPGVKLTLVTSEKDSDEVKWACDTYGLTPAYYFFHGWAALDWYRGYDRTFLMPKPQDRTITKTFIMPNRIIAGQRQHRLIMLYHIFKFGMTSNHISCPAICPAENVPIEDAIKDLVNKYPDIKEVFNTESFPMSFSGEEGSPMDSYKLSLFNECSESLLYLVTETIATGRRQHLTEKTFKPICLRMPFMIVGTRGSLQYLRSYGFKTFGHLWDESYDDEIHDDQRIEKIAFTLRAMDILPPHEKQRLFDMAQEICEYNYNHFYNGGFEQILWDELTGMLDAL
jgi:hypothetical protein